MLQKSTFAFLYLLACIQIALSYCPEPDCSTPDGQNTLYPYKHDPYKYWQCAPTLTSDGVYSFPVERDCAPGGTKFSYNLQVCVYDWEFESPCEVDVDPSDSSEIPIVEITTQVTTTIAPSSTTSTTTASIPPLKQIECCFIPGCDKVMDKWPMCPAVTEYRIYYWDCLERPNGGYKRYKRECVQSDTGEQMYFDYTRQQCVLEKERRESCIDKKID